MTSGPIRVLLVDDHAIVRAGLRAVLGSVPDIVVVGEAVNGVDAVAMTELHRPHVVVMDVSMDRMDGLEATRTIVEQRLGAQVLVLTMYTEDEYLVRVVQAGAIGYLEKTVADEKLVDAVRAVARGEITVSEFAAPILARGLIPDTTLADRAAFQKLSERERLVFTLIAKGFSSPEIAQQLSISAKTVETYKQRIGEKLGISRRVEYVQFAKRLHLVEP